MKTTITNQTTLENGLIVFTVTFHENGESRQEEFVYRTTEELNARLKRDGVIK